MRKKNLRSRELPGARITRGRLIDGGKWLWFGRAYRHGMVFTNVDFSYDGIKSWARKFGKKRMNTK